MFFVFRVGKKNEKLGDILQAINWCAILRNLIYLEPENVAAKEVLFNLRANVYIALPGPAGVFNGESIQLSR